MQDRYAGEHVFIGLDPADPYAKRLRPWDYAVLDGSLACTFGQWTHNKDGDGIIPNSVGSRPFILAIDGPQGLAGEADATVRKCESELRTPGRTPYNFPILGRPYSGFITGSVELFYRLEKSGSPFHLLGLSEPLTAAVSLLEVYPGAAWPLLADTRLPKKDSPEGRASRVNLLMKLGIEMTHGPLPTHDQLDAAIAAWTGYQFSRGEVTLHGDPPFRDSGASVIREGYIVQPTNN